MATAIRKNLMNTQEIKKLRMKAAILDELMELIEDKYLGQLMRLTEKEKNVPLLKQNGSLVNGGIVQTELFKRCSHKAKAEAP